MYVCMYIKFAVLWNKPRAFCVLRKHPHHWAKSQPFLSQFYLLLCVCHFDLKFKKKKRQASIFSAKDSGDWGQDREAVTNALGGHPAWEDHSQDWASSRNLPMRAETSSLCPPAAVPCISCCGWCPYSGLSKGNDWYTFFFYPIQLRDQSDTLSRWNGVRS